MKFLVVGDPMLSAATLAQAVRDVFGSDAEEIKEVNWEPASTEEFWYLRSQVEKLGPDAGKPPKALDEAVKGVDVIITHHTPINKELINASDASYLGVCRAGVENVDVTAASAKGMNVMRTMGRNAEAVSDFTMALMLAELRNVAKGHHAFMQGEWKKQYANSGYMGDMAGKTVGLVGFGYIGKLVARKLSGFDVKVVAYDPFLGEEAVAEHNATKVSLEELCRQSDMISIHARLCKETEGMIGEKEIAVMKPSAYIINTARAGLVDEKALINALQEHKIGGAALDVYWTEPVPADHALFKMDNVTITPHLAGATNDTFKNTPYLLLRELKKTVDSNEESRWYVK